MKKLLMSAFVVSMFTGSYAIADETIQLAAAIGATAEEQHQKKKIERMEKHIEKRQMSRDKHLDRGEKHLERARSDGHRDRDAKRLDRTKARLDKHILADKAVLASFVAAAIAVAAEAGGTSTATHH